MSATEWEKLKLQDSFTSAQTTSRYKSRSGQTQHPYLVFYLVPFLSLTTRAADPTPMSQKLCGSLEDLLRTATFLVKNGETIIFFLQTRKKKKKTLCQAVVSCKRKGVNLLYNFPLDAIDNRRSDCSEARSIQHLAPCGIYRLGHRSRIDGLDPDLVRYR